MTSNQTPIGLFLVQSAKAVSRAFGEVLAEAGGSIPVWVILLELVQKEHRTQSELAAAVGIQGPTLTHHLNAMEKEELLMRTRHPENRRVHQVKLTDKGREKFQTLLQRVISFDQQLRENFQADELQTLRSLVERLVSNTGETLPGSSACQSISLSDTNLSKE